MTASRVPIFCGYLISRVEKNYILRVLIFTNVRLRKDLRLLIFANLDFFVVDCLQQVVEDGIGWRHALKFLWGDSNDEWKCCQPPTFNSICTVAKRTLYWTKKRRNRWDFLFSSKKKGNKQKQNHSSKKKQQEKKEVRSRDI